MNGKLFFLVVCELVLLYAVILEQMDGDNVAIYGLKPSSPSIVICRFLCAIFLHISVSD